MHRSGTSAITRVLTLLGADLPRTVSAAGEDNEPGFWEPFEIVQAHDRLLREAGSSWDDVSPIDADWFDSPAAREFEDELVDLLGANYGKSRLFVVKDPRICRLIPLWLRVLARFEADPSFVITVRNPLEVAESLRRRDGFTSQKSQLLWLRHVLEAERSTRPLPRTWVSYQDLLVDWTPVAARIAADLGLTWRRMNHQSRVEIERFLSSEYRHHSFSTEDLLATPRVLPSIKRLYSLVSEATNNPDASILTDSKLTLDGIYRELGEADRAYGPLVAEARISAQEQVERLAERSAEEGRRAREELAARERAAAAAAEQVHVLTTKLARVESEFEELRQAGARSAAEGQEAIAQLEGQLTRRQEVVAQLEGELSQRREAAARAERQLSDRHEAAAQFERQLAERQEAVARLEGDLVEQQEAFAQLQGQFADRTAELDRLKAELDDRDRALVSATRELEDARAALTLAQTEIDGQRQSIVRMQSEMAERAEADAARGIELEAVTERAARLEGQLDESKDLASQLELSLERAGKTELQLRAEQAASAEALRAREQQLTDVTHRFEEVRGELSNVYRELESKARSLQETTRDAAEVEQRLREEVTRQDESLDISEARLERAKERLAEQERELAHRAKALRTAEQELRIARAQLRARSDVSFQRRLRGLGGAVAVPFVAAGTGARRWGNMSVWLARPETRAFARAYLGLRNSDAFDPDYYLANYRDVARSGMDPLMHYVQYGVRDRYNPSRSFNTQAYLAAHPELLETGENPLLHAVEAERAARARGAIAPIWRDRRGAPPALPPPEVEIVEAEVVLDPVPPPRADPVSVHAAQAPAEAIGTNGAVAAGDGSALASSEALASIPRGAIVLLAGGGGEVPDELAGRRVWDFELSGGEPGSDNRSEVDALRAKGANYLVVMGSAGDFLGQADDLRGYLDSSYRRLKTAGAGVVIYELSGQRTTQRKPKAKFAAGWSGMDVICLPIIDWNYRFQRPQQLMTQLTRTGHRVFYAATTFQRDTRRPVISELTTNVWGVRLPGRPEVNIYNDRADAEVVESALKGLAALRDQARISHAVTVVDLPFWAPIALEARERWGWKVIYDCMDEHGGFVTPEEEGGDELRQLIDNQERALLSTSDLVIATSRLLHEKVKPVARKTVLVPNATDFEHFSTPSGAVFGRKLAGHGPLPDDMPRPIVGYYGAISSWFDSEMVAHAARARPDWSFVLAGRTTGADLEPFEGLENLHLLGELPYEAVPGLLHSFDVACIPFHLIDLTLATNPVKFYEYMSAGKPVVSVELPELEPYEGYFYPARSGAEFVTQVERALAEDGPELQQRRIELGRTNTWRDRYVTLEEAIRPWYQKASIVIPSYNNAECLRMCLDSLRDKTDYPNFDVIVVDNGSDQSLIDEIAARSEHEQNLHLIPAGENLGFARATNAGIEAAGDADFVVMLNDDTVVTPGWLGRLLSHLDNKEIGMVGPVTNWTGNEARIEVPYGDDLEGLEEFAAQRAAQRQHEVFDIGVLAMYCVAIRKSLIDQLGRLEERFKIGMFEDDDFAMRVREAGLRVVCAEDVFIHHWGRASFKRMSQEEYDALFEENKRIYEQIWNRPWVPHQARAH